MLKEDLALARNGSAKLRLSQGTRMLGPEKNTHASPDIGVSKKALHDLLETGFHGFLQKVHGIVRGLSCWLTGMNGVQVKLRRIPHACQAKDVPAAAPPFRCR